MTSFLLAARFSIDFHKNAHGKPVMTDRTSGLITVCLTISKVTQRRNLACFPPTLLVLALKHAWLTQIVITFTIKSIQIISSTLVVWRKSPARPLNLKLLLAMAIVFILGLLLPASSMSSSFQIIAISSKEIRSAHFIHY